MQKMQVLSLVLDGADTLCIFRGLITHTAFMKTYLIIILAALLLNNCTTFSSEKTDLPIQSAYDSLLAAKLGADDYGMKTYVFAFLKRGPNRDLGREEAMKLQMAHLENITRMAEAGDLVLAGPFMDNGDIRGIYVFDVRTVEEAEALVNTDPAIQAGSLEMELRPWYGSAALLEMNSIHQSLQKKAITES